MSLKSKILVFDISTSMVGLRLDQALANLAEIKTRSRATKLIKAQRVLMKGHPCKPSYIVQENDQFTIDLPSEQPTTLTPYPISLDILYEDNFLMVINKPAGLVVHPSAGHATDTLVNALIHHSKDLSMGFGEQRPGIVHRLDKDTSGLLVVAKTDDSQNFLAKQFKEKTVHRIYWAIAFGVPRPLQGTFRSSLKRHPLDRKKFASEKPTSNPKGKLAVTHYKVKNQHPLGLSLIELRLETGRTHQIRVHLSEHSHPLLGDNLYGAKNRLKNIKSSWLKKRMTHFNRIGLHAAELGFVHPQTKKRMSFSSPWPDDILDVSQHLGFA